MDNKFVVDYITIQNIFNETPANNHFGAIISVSMIQLLLLPDQCNIQQQVKLPVLMHTVLF